MDGGRDHIIARLPHVDVIVGMYVLPRADRFARQLRGTIGDDFVRVRVGAGARTGLKNVQRKMVVEFSVNNFLSRLDDQRRTLCIEQAEIVICLRGSPLDQAKSANERP